jgi:hypothetical protein
VKDPLLTVCRGKLHFLKFAELAASLIIPSDIYRTSIFPEFTFIDQFFRYFDLCLEGLNVVSKKKGFRD